MATGAAPSNTFPDSFLQSFFGEERGEKEQWRAGKPPLPQHLENEGKTHHQPSFCGGFQMGWSLLLWVTKVSFRWNRKVSRSRAWDQAWAEITGTHRVSAEGLPMTVDELMKEKVDLSEWYFHQYCWLGTTCPGW